MSVGTVSSSDASLASDLARAQTTLNSVESQIISLQGILTGGDSEKGVEPAQPRLNGLKNQVADVARRLENLTNALSDILTLIGSE